MSVENQDSIFNQPSLLCNKQDRRRKKEREWGRDFEVGRKEETEWLVSSYAPPRAMHWWLTQRRGVGAGLNNEEEKIVAALTVAGEKELVCVGLLPHVWPLRNPRHQTLSNAPPISLLVRAPVLMRAKATGEECSHTSLLTDRLVLQTHWGPDNSLVCWLWNTCHIFEMSALDFIYLFIFSNRERYCEIHEWWWWERERER